MNNSFDLKYTLSNETTKDPRYSTKHSAGLDVYTNMNCDFMEILAGKTMLIPTGISLQIPENLVGLLFIRSGLSIFGNMSLTNGVGVIDPDYRGKIFISIFNRSNEVIRISNNTKIAQIVFVPRFTANLIKVDTLNASDRIGGFGSTGN